MCERIFGSASAAAGTGGVGESVLGAWAMAGALFWRRIWCCLVSADRRAYEFFLFLLACAHVWRPQEHSSGNSGRLHGAAGDSGVVRACAEHRGHLGWGFTPTGGGFAAILGGSY